MDEHHSQRPLPRRKFLLGLGGLGAAIGLGTRFPTVSLARQSSTPGSTPQWTPQPIPKPLPTQGGTPPNPVGAAPEKSGAGQATPAVEGNPVEEPGTSAQPAGSPAAATPAASTTITITPDFTFDPDQATVKKGDVVQWTNDGRSPQTVTTDPAKADDPSHVSLPDGAKPFDSGVINAGESFSHTFDVPGDYVYFSIPRESDGMIGHITVQE